MPTWASIVSLGASRVKDDGFREILAAVVAITESGATYREVFRPLKGGLLGCRAGVVSDEHESIKAGALATSWVPPTKGLGHYKRNLLEMVRTAGRKDLAEDLRGVLAAVSRRESELFLAEELADLWRLKHPKVAEHLEEHEEERLSCVAFPESHRRRIRANKGLERLNQEINSRTRVMRILPHLEACLRLVTALPVEQLEEWVTEGST